MTNTLTIRKTIENFGAKAAERQLAIIGSNSGDEQLTLIVEDLLPAEVAALVGEGDYTKPSIAAHFVSPEKFIDSLERFGARWGHIDRGTSYGMLIYLKEELEDFIFSVILSAQGERQRKLLSALEAHDIGKDILVILPFGEKGVSDVTDSFDPRMSRQGSWEELYSLIHDNSIDNLNRLIMLQRGFRDHATSDEESREQFLRRTLQDLVRVARKHSAGEIKQEEKLPEEVFDI